MRTDGQHCPITRAAEIRGRTLGADHPRNLMAGCSTYAEISKGSPGLSHSLLDRRLRMLERGRVVR